MVESGVKGDSTRMLFVGVRRSLRRIAADAGLMVGVAQGLRSLDGWEGRAGLPGRLEELARGIEEKTRIHGGKPSPSSKARTRLRCLLVSISVRSWPTL